MFASEAGEGVSSGEGRRVFVALGGGVVGETDVEQTRKSRVGRAEGEVSGGLPLARVFENNVSYSSDMRQVPRRAGARIRLMWSMPMNCPYLPCWR